MAFELFKIYDFTTLAPSILGGLHKNKKVSGILNFDTAMLYRDVRSVNEQVLPELISGTPKVEEQEFILFTDVTDKEKTLVLSTNWINGPGILVTTVDINIVVHDVNSSDVTTITNLLHDVGYTNVDVSSV